MSIFKRNKQSEVIQTIDTEQIKREARNSAIEDLLDGKLPASGFYVKPGKYDRTALSLSAVWCAIELISNSIALMPIDVKRKDKSTGNSENDKEHYLNNVFNGGQMTRFMLIKMMMVDLLCYGNGYAYIERNGKKVTNLRYLEATSVSVNYNPTTNDLFYLCSKVNNNKPIKPENMLHIYKNSKNGYEGFSILHVAKNAIDLAKATENAATDYYNKGLNIFGIFHAKVPMNKVQAEQAMNSVTQNLIGSQMYYKFLPFDIGFEKITQTAQDAQLIETRIFNLQEIARYFGISPILLYDLTHGSYNSVEAANLQFLTQTLIPYITIIENEFNKKLISERNVYIDLDERELLRTDMKSSAEYYTKLVAGGIISVNEARVNLGFNKVEGGDELNIAYTDISQNSITSNGDSDNDSDNTSDSNESEE